MWWYWYTIIVLHLLTGHTFPLGPGQWPFATIIHHQFSMLTYPPSSHYLSPRNMYCTFVVGLGHHTPRKIIMLTFATFLPWPFIRSLKYSFHLALMSCSIRTYWNSWMISFMTGKKEGGINAIQLPYIFLHAIFHLIFTFWFFPPRQESTLLWSPKLYDHKIYTLILQNVYKCR